MKKVILISGGSDGLGYAFAKALTKENTVYILSPTEQKLKKAAEELNCKYLVCDVSDYKQVENCVETVLKENGKIDVLINNAGIWTEGEIANTSFEDIKRVMEVNTLGSMYLTRAVLTSMKANLNGVIVNVNSQGGMYHKAERSVYNASKWALTGFYKCLVPEVSKYNIRFINLFPSKINTNMFSKLGVDKPLNGAIEPEDLANLLNFLLSTNSKLTFTEIGVVNLDNMR